MNEHRKQVIEKWEQNRNKTRALSLALLPVVCFGFVSNFSFSHFRSPLLFLVPCSSFPVSHSRSHIPVPRFSLSFPVFSFPRCLQYLLSNPSLGSVLGESSGQVCVITRCNYTLFNEAVNVCCAQNNTKVGFVGVRNSLNHQSRGFLFFLL